MNNYITSRQLFITKKWTYGICETIATSNAQARYLAYQITLWLEYIYQNINLLDDDIETGFTLQNIHLYVLLLVNYALEKNDELRKKNPTENLLKLVYDIVPKLKIYQIQNLIESYSFYETINIKPILYYLENLLLIIPQEKAIRSLSLIILDEYNLQFISLNSEKIFVSAACICISRLWFLNDESKKWPLEFIEKTKLSLQDFKIEYDQIYKITLMIKQIKLAKKLLK